MPSLWWMLRQQDGDKKEKNVFFSTFKAALAPGLPDGIVSNQK
jgi:hypothetical protein